MGQRREPARQRPATQSRRTRTPPRRVRRHRGGARLPLRLRRQRRHHPRAGRRTATPSSPTPRTTPASSTAAASPAPRASSIPTATATPSKRMLARSRPLPPPADRHRHALQHGRRPRAAPALAELADELRRHAAGRRSPRHRRLRRARPRRRGDLKLSGPFRFTIASTSASARSAKPSAPAAASSAARNRSSTGSPTAPAPTSSPPPNPPPPAPPRSPPSTSSPQRTPPPPRTPRTRRHLRCGFANKAGNTGRDRSRRAKSSRSTSATPTARCPSPPSLRDAGYFVPGIRPPTVPEGESLLRISLCYHHTEEMRDSLLDELGRFTS